MTNQEAREARRSRRAEIFDELLTSERAVRRCGTEFLREGILPDLTTAAGLLTYAALDAWSEGLTQPEFLQFFESVYERTRATLGPFSARLPVPAHPRVTQEEARTMAQRLGGALERVLRGSEFSSMSPLGVVCVKLALASHVLWFSYAIDPVVVNRYAADIFGAAVTHYTNTRLC